VVQSQPWANSSQDRISKKLITKKDSSGKSACPEFKSNATKKKKRYINRPGIVAQACNPSYLVDRNLKGS
jgi:hypothetical protein